MRLSNNNEPIERGTAGHSHFGLGRRSFDQCHLPHDWRSKTGDAPFHAADQWVSKKLANHGHAVALYFLHCKFCRVHKTLRVTPAMEAGIADHVWALEELVSLLDVKAVPLAA